MLNELTSRGVRILITSGASNYESFLKTPKIDKREKQFATAAGAVEISSLKDHNKIPSHNPASPHRRREPYYLSLDGKVTKHQGCAPYVRNNTSNVLEPLDEPLR